VEKKSKSFGLHMNLWGISRKAAVLFENCWIAISPASDSGLEWNAVPTLCCMWILAVLPIPSEDGFFAGSSRSTSTESAPGQRQKWHIFAGRAGAMSSVSVIRFYVPLGALYKRCRVKVKIRRYQLVIARAVLSPLRQTGQPDVIRAQNWEFLLDSHMASVRLLPQLRSGAGDLRSQLSTLFDSLSLGPSGGGSESVLPSAS
jgi:hypothetical protein